MKITLCVHVDSQNPTISYCTDMDDVQQRCFAPLNTNDDRLLNWVAMGDTEAEARMVIKTRKDAAEILAKELSILIVNAMKKNDTHNGYTK